MNSKFEKQDDLNEKFNDDLNKIKTDIESLRSYTDKNTKNIGHVLEQLDLIFGRLNDLKSLINTNNDLINNDLNKLKSYLDEKLEE